MWKTLVDLFVSLVNGGPNDSRGHRIISTLALISLTGFTVSALGKLPIFGFTGFAYASEVKEIRIDQLDDKIDSAIKSQCLAPTWESKGYYYEKIKLLKRKYWSIDPKYTPPTCRDLGVPDIPVSSP